MPRSDILTICGTGHRPDKLFNLYDPESWEPAVLYLRDYLALWPMPIQVIDGLAIGFDMMLAKAAIAARDDLGLNVRVVHAMPFEGQEKRWSPAQQALYRELIAKGDETITLYKSTDFKPYNRRNIWMVDHSHYVLACHDGQPYEVGGGGTAHCIDYAERALGPSRIVNLYAQVIEILRPAA